MYLFILFIKVFSAGRDATTTAFKKGFGALYLWVTYDPPLVLKLSHAKQSLVLSQVIVTLLVLIYYK